MSDTSRKLAIFDLDGTLYRWQLYHELVFALDGKGIFPKDASRDLKQAYESWNNRQMPFSAYERIVIDTLIDALPALSPQMFDEAACEVAERSERKTYVYTLKLLQKLKAEGYLTLAISGSQQEIVELFAHKFDFDDCIGSLYERDGDKFTGHITRFVPGNKDQIIREYITTHGYSLEGSIAVGDSDGDISMLEIVDNPIAFNPSAELLKIARARNWKTVIERKNIAYTLESDEQGNTLLTSADTF